MRRPITRMTADERAAFVAKMARIKSESAKRVGPSLAELVAARAIEERRAFYERLTPLDATRLLYAWEFWRRPKQTPPAWSWDCWLILAGRSFGKSRTAAEFVRDRITSGAVKSIALVGPDFTDIRRYMVGGLKGKERNGSGLLDVFPPWHRPDFKEGKQEIHFHTGAVAYLCSAEDRELRGANLSLIWGDEPIKWPNAQTLIDNINLTLREKGPARPQVVYTTTPRPLEFLREIILDSGTHTTHGSSRENAANLHEAWLPKMERLIGGTRFGAQELEAEVLGDNPDALFSQATIDAHHVREAPLLARVVVGIDPAASTHRTSDETGIVVVGIDADGDLYVLADYTAKMTPEEWGDRAIKAYRVHGASAIVVERNKIGDMAAANIRAANARAEGASSLIRIAETLAMGEKASRAEPVSTLYEKGRVHHVGRLARLEDELTEWDPRSGFSPNGLDALVHAICELAELDVEAKPDYRGAFRGLGEAAAFLRGPAHERVDTSRLVGALASNWRGSRL